MTEANSFIVVSTKPYIFDFQSRRLVTYCNAVFQHGVKKIGRLSPVGTTHVKMNNHEIEEQLKSVLNPNETLLWVAQPQQSIKFHWFDIFLIPFSIIWAGVVLLATVTLLRTEVVSMLFLLPFWAAAFFITVGRFFFEAKQRSKTYYGITQQRIIILSGIFSPDVDSLNIKNLPALTLSEKKDGSGSITFGNSFLVNLPGPRWANYHKRYAPCFEYIENVKQVYNKILELQSV